MMFKHWSELFKQIIKLAIKIADYLRVNQLLDAGEARYIAKQNKGSKDALQKANTARQDAIDRFDASGLYDEQDSNIRD